MTSVAHQESVIDCRIFAQHFKQLGNDTHLPTSYLCPTALDYSRVLDIDIPGAAQL
jgi:hypothetical protein